MLPAGWRLIDRGPAAEVEKVFAGVDLTRALVADIIEDAGLNIHHGGTLFRQKSIHAFLTTVKPESPRHPSEIHRVFLTNYTLETHGHQYRHPAKS